MPPQHDGRLLNNLIQREKDTLQAFKQYTLNSGSAAAALSAWSTADSASTTDLMDASTQIHHLLSSLSDTQRSYLNALTTYRSSLKEVLSREVGLRTVVRDREILVNRVIKLGNKKPKDEQRELHQAKLDDAQRELAACETYLQDEEAQLSEAKRRSFREALAYRMKSMGELGRVMEDVAIEALDILAQLDGPNLGGAFNPDDYRDDGNYEIGSDAGESIAPFDSASQAMSRASSSTSLNDDAHQHEVVPAMPATTLTSGGPSPSVNMNGASRASIRNGPATSADAHADARQSTSDSTMVSPSPSRPASRPASHLGGRSSSGHPASPAPPPPSTSLPHLHQQQPRDAPAPAQPVMPPVPTAPRAISTVDYTERHEGLPTFEIPRAPDLSRRPDDSSSDDESSYGTEHGQGQSVVASGRASRRGGGGGSTVGARGKGWGTGASTVSRATNRGAGGYPETVPAEWRSRSYPLESPGLAHASRGGGGGGGGPRLGFPSMPSLSPGKPRRKAKSDTSSIDDRPPRGRKRSGSFFGGIAALFKRKDKKGGDDDDDDGGEGEYGDAARRDAEAEYYSSRNRLAAGPVTTGGGKGGGKGGGGRTEQDVLAAVMGAGVRTGGGGGYGRSDDTSDDDEPRNVVRHVNDPKQRIKAMSDVGRSSTVSRSKPASTVGRGAATPSRPVLTRKGTSGSTARPMSMIDHPVSRPLFVEKKQQVGGSDLGRATTSGAGDGDKKKKVKKVRKAASDIGITTSGWTSTAPVDEHTTRSIAHPVASPVAPAGPAPALPHVVQQTAPPVTTTTTTTTTTTDDSGSIRKKKTKKGVKAPTETVILSAEALGIPTPSSSIAQATPSAAPASPAFATPRPAGVSRSNTVTSTTSTIKKKKKKAPSVLGSLAEEPESSKTPPTADDLAKTLPTAKSTSSPLNATLPRPDDIPYGATSTRPSSNAAPAPSSPAVPAYVKAKSQKDKLEADEKRNKRHSQLHGEGNWVSPPPSAPAVSQQPSSQPTLSKAASTRRQAARHDVYEGDESLLAVVDRAGVIDSAQPSRLYTSSKPNSGATTPVGNGTTTPSTTTKPRQPTLTIPSSASAPSVSSPSSPSGSGRQSIPASPSAGPAWLSPERADPLAPGAGGGGGGLSKRKSVRLADDSKLSVPTKNPHYIPAGSPASSSVRSASSPPRPILVNSPARGSSPVPAAAGASAGDWPTRASIRASMMDSSDEEDGDGGYLAARRALRRGTKEMEAVYNNGGNRVDKGKGRA
ncbi:hypothetical protein JCM10212_005106 [Sporobolomyces blumeae]